VLTALREKCGSQRAGRTNVRDLPRVDGLTGELALLAGILQDGTEKWRQELGVVGRDGMRYQENGDGRSICVLMLHIADCEDWWIREVAAGRPPSPENRKRFLSQETDQYGGCWPKPPRYSQQECYAILDEVRAQTLSIIRELGDPDLIGTRPGTSRQYTLRWIIMLQAHHEPYHAGQMVMLKQQWLARRKQAAVTK
jgi:uncharacterized damage-inducible protein DinB